MADSPNTATAPAKNAPVVALPFPIASRASTRFSFSESRALGAAPIPINPIQIPAVGYLRKLQLRIRISTVAGTAFPADGPFSLLSLIEFRTAAGNDIVTPMTGYQWYLLNKYAHPTVMAPFADAKVYGSAATGLTAEFILDIPFEIDPETGLGSIPALASNRSYQLLLTVAPYTTVTNATSGSITIDGLAYYWTEPPANSASGVAQATAPQGLGMINQWQLETPPLTPGDKLVKSNNVGNIIRSQILVLRNAAGARIDGDFPDVTEVLLDNETLFYLPKANWKLLMKQQHGITSNALDGAMGAASTLDSGVYVLSYDAMVGSVAGDPANSRSQYLPTLDASQLQFRGMNFGAAASTLEIMTNSVIPVSTADIYNK